MKSSLHNIAGQICFEPGALWTVDAKNTPPNLELVKAACSGKVDESVHGAWRLVKSFLSDVGSDFNKGTALLSRDLRDGQELRSVESKMRAIRFDSYATFGWQGRCLSVLSSTGKGDVTIEAGDDCYLHLDGRPVTIRFWVVCQAGTKEPLIARIEFI